MSKSRAINIHKFVNKKFDTIEFTGAWLKHLGIPQSTGIWLIWGASFNGKTSYSLELAKELTKHYRVVYNTLEEGARLSMQQAIIRANIKEVASRFQLLDGESFEAMKARMRKPKSPHVWFVDSFQYVGLTKKEYLEFKEEFGQKKLIVFISHAEGKQPAGKVAKFVRFDVDVKTRVEGYKASPGSRLGGDNAYVISEERARKYWGEKK